MNKAQVVYNVLIGGMSIGMTFNKSEAVSWMTSSRYQGDKKIVAVAYKVG